ncbi:glucose 1-dehydrogenase [Burkholderia cenocepacia]|uniref:SDR family NAD(P)-dependent oxidoreductase n=1 Tax=Burkholderia cepacia complex TaxID=87882 RepID=UPI001B943194|nr:MULTISPECIES: glucose 1-dehydrogenase [Burkholderia cepacia complex]MBR8173727.1 glucose 1-dehydrogenase [Burkholderia cenocepacia]MCO8320313.1 glucose 1-dehydrogenase [Burkholderia multivorans]
MAGRLNGKVAIVTGGASGIGLATVKKFLEEGAKVVMADIAEELGQAESAALKAQGKPVMFARIDISSSRQWQTLLADTLQAFGGFDVLVNNAGYARLSTVEKETEEDFDRQIAVNLKGPYLGIKAAIAHMKDHGGGAIVNIASVEGVRGNPLLPAYNAAKGGVRVFSRGAAVHCAREGYGIRINCVCPGAIETPIFQKIAATASKEDLDSVFGYSTARIALGRAGQPEDIANACLYLASDESKYVIGIDLPVDGGYLA